jgi:subtilisin family serine protease
MKLPRVVASALLAAGVVMLSIQTHDARAGWPPLETDDFKDPANWPNDGDYKGRWNYWSFLPTQDPNAPPYTSADKMLGASGMSLDKAWALTIGRADVKIAVLDSGIKWDTDDLVNKCALNAGELVTHKPLDAQSQACGGIGPLAGYDCNGDGVFNVADYRDDPRFTGPVAGEKCLIGMDPKMPSMNDRLKGDLNRNCILDPGDLILMFSDKNDDDGNGYTDDIAGWDFFKNDNDPYDDTRYGHGTGEAKDSAAEGNNGIDTIGTCPKCTFIPLRVGESFVTDVNEFAKAVVYAVDNKAQVVQEALGTVDNTAFSRAAIDYAYANGVVIDASMADENSRHHNAPATYKVQSGQAMPASRSSTTRPERGSRGSVGGSPDELRIMMPSAPVPSSGDAIATMRRQPASEH